jgi:secondary thiamine-phosphate synthase enzyme
MTWFQRPLRLTPRRRGFHLITEEVAGALPELDRVRVGLLHVFIQHTSASLVIQENADPDVVLDLADFFERLVPENHPRYRHTAEGPDDMPSHIRSALTQTHLSIPVAQGRMALGTWQGIYLFEHRRSAQRRSVVLQLMG